MTESQIIEKTEQFVKTTLANAEGGHDWWHIQRVWKAAKTIAHTEGGNLFVIELGALLHDIADSKFHEGDEEIGPRTARNFLNALSVEKTVVDHVDKIIRNLSFSKSLEGKKQFHSKELAVVQDADRLDAIGAIGIARTFNYGGFKNREMYNPDIKPNIGQSKDAYKNSTAPTINHFYEKLLLLKDRMQTETGKKMAAERHVYMETFLKQFYAEWEGMK